MLMSRDFHVIFQNTQQDSLVSVFIRLPLTVNKYTNKLTNACDFAIVKEQNVISNRESEF